jgi:hypothetical protein
MTDVFIFMQTSGSEEIVVNWRRKENLTGIIIADWLEAPRP